MARVVKEAEYAAKRNEILNAAEQLIFTKGYEQMSIQDILDALAISKGAFYHYFDSKPALLEAFIERGQTEVEQALMPIAHDEHLSALEKLQQFFSSLERSSAMQKTFVADLLRIWFADDNAIVREKVYAAMAERRAPLLTEIVRQGFEEGVFTTPYPDQTAGVILSLARGMGDTLAQLMLAGDEPQSIEAIVATYGAYADALERILGAPSGYLQRMDTHAVKTLVTMLRSG